ncbi:MAG: hypothetical protein ABIP49_10945 [Lysobacterales bacterium]
MLLLAGCATTQSRVANTARDAGERVRGTVVLIEPDIELSEVTAGGAQQPRADWTARARAELPAALTRQLARKGGITLAKFEVADDLPATDRTRQLLHLHRAVGHSILRHGYGIGTLPSKGKDFDWTLGKGVAVLRAATNADYALFVTVRDSYTSGGRAALMVVGALVGVGFSGGVQAGFASLVDLRDGRVVWFNTLVDQRGDLRDTEGADATARQLLDGFPS